jgi:hypothetical protein
METKTLVLEDIPGVSYDAERGNGEYKITATISGPYASSKDKNKDKRVLKLIEDPMKIGLMMDKIVLFTINLRRNVYSGITARAGKTEQLEFFTFVNEKSGGGSKIIGWSSLNSVINILASKEEREQMERYGGNFHSVPMLSIRNIIERKDHRIIRIPFSNIVQIGYHQRVLDRIINIL